MTAARLLRVAADAALIPLLQPSLPDALRFVGDACYALGEGLHLAAGLFEPSTGGVTITHGAEVAS